MADDYAPDLLAYRLVGFFLQSLHDDGNQRTDREIGGPGVGARKAELGETLVHAREQTGVVAAPALAVLAAVGVPAVGCKRALPAVGLLVPGLEERPDRLIAGGPTARAVDVHERGQRHRGLRRSELDHVHAVRKRNR